MKRIIYLGGLAEKKKGSLSKHLRSRIEVAEILQSCKVPVTDLRAPMILGSGSASFEILRYLVERLPVMITPRWVRSLNQSIAIRAEMKVPGEAVLEFKIESMGAQYTELKMLSRFLPKGLWGILYWYILYPFHEKIFFGMLNRIAGTIEKPIVSGPERFTPRLHDSCALPSGS